MKTITEMTRELGGFAPTTKFLEAFAALVRADEREACAKVCEGQIKIFLSPQYKTGQPMSSFGERHAVASCVEAIRARGNT
jgi:hypothetical protein